MGVVVSFIVFLLVSEAPGGELPSVSESTTPVAAKEPWPADQLVGELLSRWADELVSGGGFDPEQTNMVRRVIGDRWSTFLVDHREELETVLDGYLELGMEEGTSSPQALQDWAKGAWPLISEIRRHAADTMRAVSARSDEKQRPHLTTKSQEINEALKAAEDRLADWRVGKFGDLSLHREGEFADPKLLPAARHVVGDVDQPVDQIQIEMDAWQQYVTSFSERFRFDKGQCDAARSCLEELQERARAHRDRYSKRIIELERCIAAFTGDPSEQQRIQRDLIELYGPIDSMFAELTQRLEKIPAKDQRERASGPKAIPGGE